MPLVTREQRASFVETVWSIGFVCFLVGGLLLLAVSPILIPAFAALLLMICAATHLTLIKTDEGVLIGCTIVEVLLAWITPQLAAGAPPRFEALSNGLFMLAVVLPIACGIWAVRLSRAFVRRRRGG